MVKKLRASQKKGRPPGSRQQQIQSVTPIKSQQARDPRVGSKQPVDLTQYHSRLEYPVFDDPSAELVFIESHELLDELIEKKETGRLSRVELQFFERLMSRYEFLIELLGIDGSEDE